jgi:hypothetical protein
MRNELRLVVGGLVLLFAFTAVYVAAFNDPEPHGVRIGVVGGPEAMRAAHAGLDSERFELVPYASQQAATAALGRDDLRGVLTLRPGTAGVAIASAYGAGSIQPVKEALMGVAGRAGPAPRLADVRPLPKHDSRGLSSFFAVTGTAIASLLFGALMTFAGRGLPLRGRLAACTLIAVCGGLVVALAVETVVGALSTSFLGVAGILALLVAAVAWTAHGLGRLVGPVGLAAAGALFLLLGTSSAGGGVTYELEPGFYRAISQALPNGAAVTAVRNEVYFGGAHTLGALAVLAAWAIAGALLIAAGVRR